MPGFNPDGSYRVFDSEAERLENQEAVRRIIQGLHTKYPDPRVSPRPGNPEKWVGSLKMPKKIEFKDGVFQYVGPPTKSEGTENKMARDSGMDVKSYSPSDPKFASDETPFEVGQIISIVGRHGESGTHLLITDVQADTEVRHEGSPVGGTYYTGYASNDYDRSTQVIKVENGTAVTVWTEYDVPVTPKGLQSLSFPKR